MNNTCVLSLINYIKLLYIIKFLNRYRLVKYINNINNNSKYLTKINIKSIPCILILLFSIVCIKVTITFAMDKNSDMNDKEASTPNISNFLKGLVPKKLHCYLDDEQTELDINVTAIKESQKTKNPSQKSIIINCTIIHPQLREPLIFGSYTQVNQSELELLKTLVQQPITIRQLAQLGLSGAESSNKLQTAAQLTSPLGSKRKYAPVSSTETLTTRTSSSIETSSIPQSTQSASSSIITTSNLEEPVVRPKIPSTKQGKNKAPLDKPQTLVTASKRSVFSLNLQLLENLGLQKIKAIYEEGQSTLHILLQTIKDLHREGQADKELTEKYRSMLEQQVELAKFIKEKEEEEQQQQIKQVMKRHENVQDLLEMLKKNISCSTSTPEQINFDLLSLPVDQLSQLDLTTLKNIFEPVESKRRTLEDQIRQQIKEGKQVDPTLQQKYQYLVTLQTDVLMATKNFSEEKLSQLPPTSGLAYRLQEVKAITQLLKEKIPPSPKSEDGNNIQFIILEKKDDRRSETSKTTVRINQQGIQTTNTKEKTKKKNLIATLDKSSSLLETDIEPPHSSEQQSSSSSNSTKKKKKEKKTSPVKTHTFSANIPSEEVITTTSISSEQTTVQMPLEAKTLVATGDKQQPSSSSHHKQKKKQTQTSTLSSNQSLLSIHANSPSPSIESTSQQSNAMPLKTKEAIENECTPDIPRKKKEKKKHLKHTPKNPSSSIPTCCEEEKTSTSNEDSTIPYPTLNRPEFEELKIPDTPKKKPKKKKKPGLGTLVGDSLLSEGRTTSTSDTTPIQPPSGFINQDHKDKKEALKNCPLSPPDEFSDDDNTKEDSGPMYIPGVFCGNNLDLESPRPKKPHTYLPNIIGDVTSITTETLETLDIYNSPLGEGEEDNEDPQKNVGENEEIQVAVRESEQSQAQQQQQQQPQCTNNTGTSPLGQNTPQHPIVAQTPAQPTPLPGNGRRARRQQTRQTQLLTKKHPSTNSLIAELLPEGQFSSLQSLQFALSDTSEFISETLKSLALKAHFSSKHLSTTTHKKLQLCLNNRKTSGSLNKSTIENTNIIEALQPTKSYTVFTSINKYTTNLENKLRSAQAGIMLNFSPTTNIGLAYNFNKKEYKEYSGTQLNSSNGSVKSKSTTDGLAAIFTLNPEKKGITGTMIGFYSWGKVTNSRRVTHGEKHIVTKGSPDITLTGGLIHLGYNIPAIKTLILTPYIGCLVSNVRWSPYTEEQSPVVCKISENRENLLEKSIGLKTKWELTEYSQLQTWIVGSSGLKQTNSLSSNSMITPLFKYTISAPSYKKKYTKAEGGLSYEVQLSPTLTLDIDGILSFEKRKKIEKKQHISFHFNYYY